MNDANIQKLRFAIATAGTLDSHIAWHPDSETCFRVERVSNPPGKEVAVLMGDLGGAVEVTLATADLSDFAIVTRLS